VAVNGSGGREQMAVESGWCWAIWDGGMSVWCHWRTCVVSLVGLCDSGCGNMRNKWKENADDFTA
jgi:hypothetical protein